MTIAAEQIVLQCWVVIEEVFDDSGSPGSLAVINDPEGAGTQLSNGPTPTSLGATAGAVKRTGAIGFTTPGNIAAYRPASGPITPVLALDQFAGDGTTGRAMVFTTIYTPPA